MSIRSEVLDLLHGRPGRMVPWFGDLSYYYFSLERQGRLEKKHQGPEGEKRFYADFGVGIYLYTPDVFSVGYSERVKYTEVNTAERISPGATTRPWARSRACRTIVPAQYCFAYTRHFVRTIEDLRVMRYVFENARVRRELRGLPAPATGSGARTASASPWAWPPWPPCRSCCRAGRGWRPPWP